MVSVWFERARKPTTSIVAKVTVGRARIRTYDVDVCSVGWQGLVLDTDALDPDCRHAWIQVDLPGVGRIRPLVQIGQPSSGHTPVRFRHLFPGDIEVLEAFHTHQAMPPRPPRPAPGLAAAYAPMGPASA